MEENSIKASVQKQFGKNADKFVNSQSHAKGEDLPVIVDWLSPESHWTVLDIATGGGHVTKTLSPHVAHIFSTDLTQKMLESARKYLSQSCSNVWYVIADAEALPFLDESFDAVVCRIAPHHFPNPEKFVEEVHRVLKQNGKFILIDNVSPEEEPLDIFVNTLEKLRDESHVRCYSLSEWKNWFQKKGFIIQNSNLRKKTFDFPVWVRRTTETEEDVERVERYILQSSQDIQNYFSVQIKENKVVSLQIDEWMVHVQKGDIKA